jgi:hypothetical protein
MREKLYSIKGTGGQQVVVLGKAPGTKPSMNLEPLPAVSPTTEMEMRD